MVARTDFEYTHLTGPKKPTNVWPIWMKTLEVQPATIFSMVVEMVPVKGGKKVANRPSPNWQEKSHLYTTYILPNLGGEKCYGSHLLWEPVQQPLIF